MTDFLTDWSLAMRIDSVKDVHKPTRNRNQLTDCTILARNALLQVTQRESVRNDKPFDPRQPELCQFEEVQQLLPSLETQLRHMKLYQDKRVPQFLKVWESSVEPLQPEVKTEPSISGDDDNSDSTDQELEVFFPHGL